MDNRLNLVVQFGQKGLDKLQGGLKNLVGLGKTGSKAFRDMARESRSLERELAGVRRELDGAAGNVSELVNRERELERAVASANEKLRRQRALTEIDDRATAMRTRGDALVSKGQANVAGGAMMLTPLLLAGKAAADFSSGMVDIQQKAELSDEATARLRNNIIGAARASKQMPEDMRAAVDTLAGLGIEDPRDAVRAAKPMGQFMTAFKVEGTDAAASVYAGLASLEIPLNRTTKLLDMMAAGGNQGAFEVRDMARAFPGLTAQLKAMGQTGEKSAAELIAALEIVRRGTGTSDEAATNMQNLLAKLTATTTLAQFEKKGINAFAEIKRGIDAGISPLETMIRLTNKATGGDKMRIGELFPDMQAQSAMRQLMLDFEDFQKMKGEVGAAEGLTSRAFDQRVANDQTVQLRELGGAMANLALSVAPVLLPFLREVTSMLSSGATVLSTWAQEHPQAASMLLKLVAGLAVGKIALGALQIAFGGLLGPMSTAYKYFAKVDGVSRFGAHLTKFKGIASTTASVGVKAFGLLRSGAMLLARGLLRAGMMMLANPMVLLIAGIVVAVGLLAYAVYSNWDKIKAGFSAGWAYVTNLLGGAANWMSSIGRQMMNGLLSAINPMALATKLVDVAKNGISRFKAFLGIKSPSRVFMEMGGHVAGGLALGIDRRGPTAMASARRLAAGVAGAAALGTGAPLAAGGAGAASLAPSAGDTYQITIHQLPGQSAEDLADEVMRKIEEKQRRRGGSEFGDG
jgi:TP901 family phage tail tape measure protein